MQDSTEGQENKKLDEIAVKTETQRPQFFCQEAITQALQVAKGNRRQAAQLLGIGVRTLYRKLDEYHLK